MAVLCLWNKCELRTERGEYWVLLVSLFLSQQWVLVLGWNSEDQIAGVSRIRSLTESDPRDTHTERERERERAVLECEPSEVFCFLVIILCNDSCLWILSGRYETQVRVLRETYRLTKSSQEFCHVVLTSLHGSWQWKETMFCIYSYQWVGVHKHNVFFFFFTLFTYAASQCAYLYYALKVCTLLVKKKYTLLICYTQPVTVNWPVNDLVTLNILHIHFI